MYIWPTMPHCGIQSDFVSSIASRARLQPLLRYHGLCPTLRHCGREREVFIDNLLV